MSWEKNYIGAYFKENGRGPDFFDCYGLVWHIQLNVFNRSIPKLDGEYENTRDVSIPTLCRKEAELWKLVPLNEEVEGDVALFRIKGEPWHVSTILGSKGKMIHILRGIDCCVESYHYKYWNRRLEGIYRWEG